MSDIKAEDDAAVVKILRHQGAIPFVKSNMPQIFWNECENHMWGIAQNPWCPTRSPGGSSGGEGGLICSRSSPIGVGTDVGGSLRYPA